MHVHSFSFNFIYRKEHPIVCQIYNLLEEMFGMAGEYESNKIFHKSGILITADEKELQLFRIILNAHQVEAIKEMLSLTLHVDFDNFFIPIQNMNNKKYNYLPVINYEETTNDKIDIESDVIGNSPCPCCGFITIPNNGDALAYICPICFWEIDLFIQSNDEASDQNHSLTLTKARKNYQQFGAVLPDLKEYCRQPKKYEYPNKMKTQ